MTYDVCNMWLGHISSPSTFAMLWKLGPETMKRQQLLLCDYVGDIRLAQAHLRGMCSSCMASANAAVSFHTDGGCVCVSQAACSWEEDVRSW